MLIYLTVMLLIMFPVNKDRTQILPCAMCDDIQGATTQVGKAIEKFRQTKAYKEHVIPLARLGRRFDEGLKKGI